MRRARKVDARWNRIVAKAAWMREFEERGGMIEEEKEKVICSEIESFKSFVTG